MPASKVHEVTIKVRFSQAVTAREARYAVWNNFQDHEIYGDGKPGRYDERSPEPYDTAKIKVRR